MQVDLEAIEKWRTKDGEYAERAKELEEATKERDEVRRVVGDAVLCGGGRRHGALLGCCGVLVLGLTVRSGVCRQ